MSYDLMVFNPEKAPKLESAFIEWYNEQTKWEEDHSYDDPKVTSVELRNWFLEITQDFPDLNGPTSPDNIDDFEDELTDYSIGNHIIYAGFSWSQAEKAYPKVLKLAQKHQVGFYNPSGDGGILFPNLDGELKAINSNKNSKPWWKFW